MNNGSIQSAQLDGSDVTEIIKKGDVHTQKRLTIDQVNQKLYFSNREGLRVHRSNFDVFNKVEDKGDETKWVSHNQNSLKKAYRYELNF